MKYVGMNCNKKNRRKVDFLIKSRLFATMAGGMAEAGRTFVPHAMAGGMGLEKGCLAGRHTTKEIENEKSIVFGSCV